MLIPFYIFSHGKGFPEYNNNGQKLAELKAEYQKILERLGELEQQGVIGAFDRRTIIEPSSDVIKEITQKYEYVQKGVGDIMGGALIETEARRILNKGISETKKETALRMLKRGKNIMEFPCTHFHKIFNPCWKFCLSCHTIQYAFPENHCIFIISPKYF